MGVLDIGAGEQVAQGEGCGERTAGTNRTNYRKNLPADIHVNEFARKCGLNTSGWNQIFQPLPIGFAISNARCQYETHMHMWEIESGGTSQPG